MRAGIANATHVFMKCCGQWLTLLWVTVALLLPPTATQAGGTPDNEATQWEESQPATLALFSDFTFSVLKKAEDQSSEEQSQPKPLLPETALRHAAPVCFVSGTIVLLGECPVFRVMIGLPLSRGPPAHA